MKPACHGECQFLRRVQAAVSTKPKGDLTFRIHLMPTKVVTSSHSTHPLSCMDRKLVTQNLFNFIIVTVQPLHSKWRTDTGLPPSLGRRPVVVQPVLFLLQLHQLNSNLLFRISIPFNLSFFIVRSLSACSDIGCPPGCPPPLSPCPSAIALSIPDSGAVHAKKRAAAPTKLWKVGRSAHIKISRRYICSGGGLGRPFTSSLKTA